MYYVMRASAPSLHRESTDSLIQIYNYIEREFASIKSINDDLKRDSFKLHSIYFFVDSINN